MRILVTGGAGYVGTHIAVALIEAGHTVSVLDNFSNSSPVAIDRVNNLTGATVTVHEGDVVDGAFVTDTVHRERPEAVIHCAGLKAVGDSVGQPLDYYATNVGGTLTLLQALQDTPCRAFVFSSSGTVYGQAPVPFTESTVRSATSPYGSTKIMVEDILADLVVSDPRWRIARLRYFNPVGAHPSGTVGEDPCGVPLNLMPLVARVAAGVQPELLVYGQDYPTPDGTALRDYVHVCDVAEGHVAALNPAVLLPGCHTWNLGTGVGSSVLDIVRTFSHVTGVQVPYRVVGRRPGDVVAILADPSKARRELGWAATRTLQDMCRDLWTWQQHNPEGYRSA